LKVTLASVPFGHGRVHRIDQLPGAVESGAKPLIDVYHVSLQNTNTGRLTPTMFDEVVALAKREAGLG